MIFHIVSLRNVSVTLSVMFCKSFFWLYVAKFFELYRSVFLRKQRGNVAFFYTRYISYSNEVYTTIVSVTKYIRISFVFFSFCLVGSDILPSKANKNSNYFLFGRGRGWTNGRYYGSITKCVNPIRISF